LLDTNGKLLFLIRDEMSDWEIGFDKIRKKVQEVHKYDPVVTSAADLLRNRHIAWQNSRRIVVVLAILVWLPFAIHNIIDQKQALYQVGRTAVTLPSSYISLFFLENRVIQIPYQDTTGQIWYTFAYPHTPEAISDTPEAISDTPEAISDTPEAKVELPDPDQDTLEANIPYNDIRIQYLPQNPGYAVAYGNVQDLQFVFLNFLEKRGFDTRNLEWMEYGIIQSTYFFWGLAVFLFILSLLRQNTFAGLLLQKMPAPLGPKLYLSGTVILQNTLRLLLHFGLLLLLAFLAFYLYFPSQVPTALQFPLPFPGVWIAMIILLPVMFCPYLAYYIAVVIPRWLRSFKTWELTEEGIREGSTKLVWSEIRSINVFMMPTASPIGTQKKPTRRVALIQGINGTICLEGDLVHFDTIVAHIRKKANCESNSFAQAKHFYRKHYARPKVIRMLTCIAILSIMFIGFSWIRDQQDAVYSEGQKIQAEVKATFFQKFAFISYTDANDSIWYTIAWKREDTEFCNILLDPQYPMFWESADYSIESLRGLWTDQFIKPWTWWQANQDIMHTIIQYILYGCLALLIIPLLWHILGSLFGIPPLEPTKIPSSKKK